VQDLKLRPAGWQEQKLQRYCWRLFVTHSLIHCI